MRTCQFRDRPTSTAGRTIVRRPFDDGSGPLDVRRVRADHLARERRIGVGGLEVVDLVRAIGSRRPR
jgi:hypothetical protein